MSEKLDLRPYSDADIAASIRSLRKWRDSNGKDYPLVIGAVLPVLDALERFGPPGLLAALEFSPFAEPQGEAPKVDHEEPGETT